MADEQMNFIMQDLQNHLQRANLKLSQISSIAKKGDEKLVEQFLSESVFHSLPSQSQDGESSEQKAEMLQSQLYVACFWGFRDIVKGILELSQQHELDVSVNAQNRGTLWTPLHAATFQEHGPIVMLLLQQGAQPELQDSDGRTPKDFASASDKIWGHFAALGLLKTPKSELAEMGIIKLGGGGISPRSQSQRSAGHGLKMASYESPDADTDQYSDSAASFGGDVLANDDTDEKAENWGRNQPRLTIYK